ncbi:hypothetical protein IAT38_001903 [Cryptococcus sp. DSM 104549]
MGWSTSSRPSRTPLANSKIARNASLLGNARPEAASTHSGVKGVIIQEDAVLGGKAKVEKKSVGTGVGDARFKALEKKVDLNAQMARDKISSLDDRVTNLNAHVVNLLSKNTSSTTPSAQDATPTKAQQPMSERYKSPPVPALKRRIDEAAEWERTMLSGEITLSGIDEVDVEEEEVEEQDGGEGLQELREKMLEQQEMIDQLAKQNAEQAAQITSLLSGLQSAKDVTTQLQYDLDVERGKAMDLEGRVVELEEVLEVRDASLALDSCPITPLNSKSQSPRSGESSKRKSFLEGEEEEGLSIKRQAVHKSL